MNRPSRYLLVLFAIAISMFVLMTTPLSSFGFAERKIETDFPQNAHQTIAHGTSLNVQTDVVTSTLGLNVTDFISSDTSVTNGANVTSTITIKADEHIPVGSSVISSKTFTTLLGTVPKLAGTSTIPSKSHISADPVIT